MRPDYCPLANEPCQAMCDPRCLTKHPALDHLLDLLAILHGDGGHYVDAHGMDKAVADAKERYYARITSADAENHALKTQLATAMRQYELEEKESAHWKEKYTIAQHAADCLEAKCNALESHAINTNDERNAL